LLNSQKVDGNSIAELHDAPSQHIELKGVEAVRLSEDRIKEAILDTDPEIRQRAVRYFAKSFSSDTSVAPLVIEAVETFGREDAYHLIGLSSDLPQTEDTIDWIIGELNDGQSDQYENYTYNLSRVLIKADASLLLPNESAILDSLHFLAGLHAPLTERLQMLSWDETTCWRELETLCEEGKDIRYINEFNLDYGRRIVEALSRYGDECEDRVHELLRQKVEDYNHNPMKWLEPLIVRLAGETHLESTIPLLVSKLIEDGGDLMNEECAEALTRIGTAAVIDAVSEAYATAPHHFRLYATNPLENIHSDLAVETCLSLLQQEQDTGIRVDLAHALLTHFAQAGVEDIRTLLTGRKLDFESRELRNYLVETCTITGDRFPEYDDWKSAEKTEKEEHRKRVNELKDDPAGLLQFALEKLTDKSLPSSQPEPNPPVTLQNTQRVGRNDPCPCGSGKKFKKCCLNKSSGDPLLN
jgi:hypothetical protein